MATSLKSRKPQPCLFGFLRFLRFFTYLRIFLRIYAFLRIFYAYSEVIRKNSRSAQIRI